MIDPKDPSTPDPGPEKTAAASNSSELPTLDRAVTTDGFAVETSDPGAFVGSIGPYKLLRKLGEGGMGIVWLAEQLSPLKRQVALKLIKAGRYDSTVIQRFESERQAVAIMDHPAIAKVFDAGSTSEGQPYFVMEYVPGQPITWYCDSKKLKLRERLQLFVQVCEGVQHAHQKAIIHRDLKPSNILVVEVDGKPMPRIIDFSIAKAISPKPGMKQEMFTRIGTIIGTPGFMSPEQVDPGILDVDTRTDVYSLGVLLYVLLTGALPFDPEHWRTKPLDEVLRELRQTDPLSPSEKLKTERDTTTKSAERRGTQPQQLLTMLRGDLDWITMKAIEKDRERRYRSPLDLAADIERYLENRPVVARPASAIDRARKYVLRHRVAVVVASGALLMLLAFALTQAIQLRRITRERDRADDVTEFMTSMFKVSDPSESRGKSITVHEVLDKSANNIDKSLAKDPQLQARMMEVMGTVYQNLGLYPEAHSLLSKALRIQTANLGPDHPDTLKTRNDLSSVLGLEGHYSEAEQLARETLDISRKKYGEQNPNTLRALSNLALLLRYQGQIAESVKLTRQVADGTRAMFGPESPETLKLMGNLAQAENELGNYKEAEQIYKDTFEIQSRVLGSDHPDTLKNMNNLAANLADQGRYQEAEKVQRQLLEVLQRVLGPDHPETLGCASNLANYVSNQDRNAEAEVLFREIYQRELRVLGPDHPDTLITEGNLANSLSELGKYDEAESLERHVIDARRRQFGAHFPGTAEAVYNLACMYALQGRREEAFAALREALDGDLRVKVTAGMETDSDLKSLHGDPRFAVLLAQAKEKSAASKETHP